MTITKVVTPLETKLQRIAERSKAQPELKFDKLMPLFKKENLILCFHDLKDGRATGIDKIDKETYGANLEVNIDSLVSKMKTMSYRPLPVKEVLIPKDDGGVRPLGISVIEDKIIQLMYAKILESIFDPQFLDCSYGFRPKRSCHQAIKEISGYIYNNWSPVIIDADVKNYFGAINHAQLLEFILCRIEDNRFLNYLVRILKAGVLRQGCFSKTDEGSPQGAVCSPVLSNIYAHYVLDLWVKEEVAPRCPGIQLIRYADDFVICCPNQVFAKRIQSSLSKRFGKFNLQLHETKTKLVVMNKNNYIKGERQGTFNFLGFTFYLSKSQKGRVIPKLKTDRKKFKSKLKRVKEWLKVRRSMNFKETWQFLNRKLEGHTRYYGVSNNAHNVSRFIHASERLFFKWMNRRSQKRSMTWDKFILFRQRYPGVQPYIYFSLFHDNAK